MLDLEVGQVGEILLESFDATLLQVQQLALRKGADVLNVEIAATPVHNLVYLELFASLGLLGLCLKACFHFCLNL